MTEQSKYNPASETKNQQTSPLAHPENLQPTQSATLHMRRLALTEATRIDTNMELTPIAFLQAMRANIRERRSTNSPTLIPATYNQVKDNLFGIHDSLRPYHQYGSTPDTKKLLYNTIRFHMLSDSPPRLTFSFLERLYSDYWQDIKLFYEENLAKSPIIALFHSPKILEHIAQKYNNPHRTILQHAFASSLHDPETVLDHLSHKHAASTTEVLANIEQIHERYPDIPMRRVEAWAIDCLGNNPKGVAAIHTLLGEMPQLTCAEENIAPATEQLQLLRKARHHQRENISGRYAWEPECIRFAYLAGRDRHTAFDVINVQKEAKYLWSYAFAYNQKLDSNANEHAIAMDPQNLYRILVAFAYDVAILQRKGTPSYAAHIARYFTPDIYDRCKEKYPDIPTWIMHKIIGVSPTTIEKQVKRRRRQLGILKDEAKEIKDKNMLEDFRENADHELTYFMSQWMIDRLAALAEPPQHLRQKLTALATIYRHADQMMRLKGLRADRDGGRAAVERLFSRLTPLDNIATKVVFGVSNEMSKAELENELDVPNLDEYVLNEIVVYLTR